MAHPSLRSLAVVIPHPSSLIPVKVEMLLCSATDLDFMSNSSSEAPTEATQTSTERPPSYVKLAMRNMVRKRGKSLVHFGLTTIALLGILVGLSYLTR
jgi:hypothetical protein